MELARRRRRGILVLILAALAGCTALSGARVWWSAGERLGRTEQEILAEIERRRLEGFRRPPLFDDPLTGDAWGYYEKAVAARKAISGDGAQMLVELHHLGPPVFPARSRLEAAREAYRPCGDEVFRALRCGELRCDFKYERGTKAVHETPFLELWKILLLSAEADRLAGRDGDALRHLLALQGLSQDARRGVDAYWFSHLPLVETLAGVVWRPLFASHALAAEDLAAASRALDRLEDSQGSVLEACRVQHLLERADIIGFVRREESCWVDGNPPRWKHLWTWRLALCGMLNDLERDQRELAEVARLPVHERAAAADRIPVRETYGRPWHGVLWYFAEDLYRQVDFSLMRIAVAVASYEMDHGRLPSGLSDLVPRYLPRLPLCPYSGRPFRYKDGRIWSIGGDGDDDGGRPLAEPVDYSSDGDIVWTVTRRPR